MQRFPIQAQSLPAPQASAAETLASTELLRICSDGNSERAWREFVRRFHPRLVTAVRRTLLRLDARLPDGERVEDLVQEIYCRLLAGGRRSLRHFHGESEAELVTYLQRVAESVVVDARRLAYAGKRWGGQRIPFEEWRELPANAGGERDSPEEQLFARERRREFLALCRRALGGRATPIAVRIARLALLEGWTSREIAARLAGRMGVAGVDSVIYRLRRNLARHGIRLPRRERRRGA